MNGYSTTHYSKYIGAAVVILLVVLLLTAVIVRREQIEPNPAISVPTKAAEAVFVISPQFLTYTVNPLPRTKDVPLDQTVSFTFVSPITTNDFTLSVVPDIPHTVDVVDKTVTFKPTKQYETGTIYSVAIRFKKNHPTISTSFTTLGSAPATQADTRPVEDFKREEEELKKTRPDMHLSNQLPYTSSDFDITYGFKDSTNRFYFIVALKAADTASAKQAAINWIMSKGITEEQINSLDITYTQ